MSEHTNKAKSIFLAAIENHLRRQNGEQPTYTVADAVAKMVRFARAVTPEPEWTPIYAKGLKQFQKLAGIKKKKHG